jgi:hypothetical protein
MHQQPIKDGNVPEWQNFAATLIKADLDAFVDISVSISRSFGFLQSRVKSEFPKICRKCGKSYKSFEEFYYETSPIERGTVSYPTLGSEFYLHRNCKDGCGSTLVVVFNDRRDETDLGSQRRAAFKRCLDTLVLRMGLTEEAARDLLFSLLRERFQG